MDWKRVGTSGHARRIATTLALAKPWIVSACSRHARFSRWYAARTHEALFVAQWGIPPTPEWFDHDIDAYFTHHAGTDDLAAQRGVFSRIALEGTIEIEAADIIIVVTDEAGRGVAGSRVSGVHLPASRTVEATFAVPSPPFREGAFGLNLGVRTTDSQERLFHHAGVATLSFFCDDALGGGTIRLGGAWSTT